MQQGPAAQIARVERSREELAKAWLQGMIDRTPIEDLDQLPIDWISRETPHLITDILRSLADPFVAPDLRLAADARERAGQLGKLRRSDATETLPRDLAALQALLIAALRREVPETQVGEFARAVERLAEVFGAMQAAITESLVEERSGGAAHDEVTGLPCAPHLHEWLRMLIAGHQRYGQPLAVLAVHMDGLDRLNDAYGQEVGNRMLVAVADMTRQQIRSADQAFRVADDEFCILAPSQESEQVRPLAQRLRGAIDGWQAANGPRVAISVGIASCPEHGETADDLLKAAEEAAYRARATGEGVAVGPASDSPSMQAF